MPIHSSELEQKITNLDSLAFTQLIEQLNPDSLFYNLRWLTDIRYQHAVAQSIVKQLEHGQAISSNLQSAGLYQKLGATFIQMGEFSKATDYYGQCQAILISDETIPSNIRLEMTIQCEIGLSIALREQYRATRAPEAISKLAHAMTLCDQLAGVNHVLAVQIKANALREWGLIYLINGEYKEAQAKFEQASTLCNDPAYDLKIFQLPIENYVALCSFKLNRQEDAMAKFKAVNESYLALSNAIQVTDPNYACQDYGSHVVHFGMLCVEALDFARAIDLFNEALIFRKDLTGQNKNRIADIYEWLSKAYLGQGIRDKAIECIKTAQEIYELLPVPDLDKAAKLKSSLVGLEPTCSSPNAAYNVHGFYNQKPPTGSTTSPVINVVYGPQ